MEYYRRWLPHWHPEGTFIFITWRLFGSLPGRAGLRPALLSPGQQFAAFDRQLDTAMAGPLILENPKIATCVEQTLLRGERDWKLYTLNAWVIMPNHVHVLIKPNRPVPSITRSLKSASAREANKILERQGQPFWQYESYDRWMRNEDEFNSVIKYIENNPVKAGLCERAGDWWWSSACDRSGRAQAGGLLYKGDHAVS